MKNLILVLSLVLPSASFAHSAASSGEPTTAELMESLIVQSNELELIGGWYGDNGLAKMLASATASETLVAAGESVNLISMSSDCTLQNDKIGESFWKCTLSITDGTYTQTSDGYVGPADESSRTLNFDVKERPTSNTQNSSPKFEVIGTTVNVMIAG